MSHTQAHLFSLAQMSYAELLWVDRLGMWVRAEAAGHLQGTTIVRVPFYRPVLDERDARSVITMAAQVGTGCMYVRYVCVCLTVL